MGLNVELSNELKDRFGGDISELEPVESGYTHETFFFSHRGRELVVQALTGGQDKEYAIKRKAKVYELADEYSVEIPELVLAPKKLSFEEKETVYFVVERASGTEMKEGFEKNVLEDLGEVLANIHSMEIFEHPGWLKPVEEGFEPFEFDEGSYEDWIISNLKEDIEVLRQNGMVDTADKAQQFLKENIERVPTDFKPVLCHNDYSADNIITENGEINGVIDFDYVFSSDPRRDLVKAANSFQIEGIDIRKKLYKNYLKTNQVEGFERVEPFYRVETMVRIVASLFHLNVSLNEKEKQKYSEMISEAVKNN